MKSIQLKVIEILEKGKLDNIMMTAQEAIIILNRSGLKKENKYEYAWILDHIEDWKNAMFQVKDSIERIK